jgi:hypothetical protein
VTFSTLAARGRGRPRHTIEGRKVQAPETLVKHYPELKEAVEIEDGRGNYALLG